MSISPVSYPSRQSVGPGLIRPERGELLIYSHRSTTAVLREGGESPDAARVETSFLFDALYTPGGKLPNPVNTPPVPGPAENIPVAEGNEASAEPGAGAGYLEIIRERVAYLLRKAAEQSAEYREKLAGSAAGDQGDAAVRAETLEITGIIAVSRAESTAESVSLPSYFSAENTAARIIRFALSFYGGGDRKEYAAMVREAVLKGFEDARAALGGFLPEVSFETLDLVNAALDDFARGQNTDVLV